MASAVAQDFERQAARVAVAVAQENGLAVSGTTLLAHWSNVLIHLHPHPIVARVAATTAWIRDDVEDRLRREIEVATYLRAQAVAVVAPSELLPARPFAREGLVMSFWQHVPLHELPASCERAAARLHQLHAALQHYAGELPSFSRVVEEIRGWIDRAHDRGILLKDDAIMLRDRHAAITDWFACHHYTAQALHGDAQIPNLLRLSDDRLLWNDFEDACHGPTEWDLTCFARRAPEGPQAALAHYPGAPSWQELKPFLALRHLQGTVWYAVLAARGLTSADEAQRRIAGWRTWSGLAMSQ